MRRKPKISRSRSGKVFEFYMNILYPIFICLKLQEMETITEQKQTRNDNFYLKTFFFLFFAALTFILF